MLKTVGLTIEIPFKYSRGRKLARELVGPLGNKGVKGVLKEAKVVAGNSLHLSSLKKM